MLEFKNGVLEMKQINDTKFVCDFLGDRTTYSCSKYSLEKYFNEVKSKRTRAYDLVPDGCKIIPASLASLLNGLFIGGVLTDSIDIVYGLGTNCDGIRGYSCSLYFIPSKEVVDSISDYKSLHGNFLVK